MVDPIPTAVLQTPQEQIALAQAAHRSATLPRLYANGVISGQTASDVTLVLLMNGTPSGTLNMSYETAKSLVDDLTNIVKNFEKVTGQTVTTINENTTKMSQVMGQPNVNPAR